MPKTYYIDRDVLQHASTIAQNSPNLTASQILDSMFASADNIFVTGEVFQEIGNLPFYRSDAKSWFTSKIGDGSITRRDNHGYLGEENAGEKSIIKDIEITFGRKPKDVVVISNDKSFFSQHPEERFGTIRAIQEAFGDGHINISQYVDAVVSAYAADLVDGIIQPGEGGIRIGVSSGGNTELPLWVIYDPETGTYTLQDASRAQYQMDGNTNVYLDDEGVVREIDRNPDFCFLPGTPITLSDGATTKPIEEIAPGDEVLSYTDNGTLVPGRVTATSSKTAAIVLDWFGLGVTPGHVTLCGVVPGEEDTASGPFMGRHVPLIDILCTDGAVVRQDGSLVRAATNEPVGSRADAFVRLAYSRTGEELKAGVSHEASIRAGTKLITGEGNTVCVLDVIEANGYAFDEETGLVSRPLADGTPGVPGPLPFFGMPPKPEDHVLNRSGTALEAIHKAGEWEEGQVARTLPARLHDATSNVTDEDRPLRLS